MFCAISGQIPNDPVISRKSGHIFERNLIIKAIENDGKCPITDTELAIDDLIPVVMNKAVKPRTTTTTSIPGLLSQFQNEWDALMLETFNLKKHLDVVRQELSQALYQYDAACRVIARLIKERDEARQAMVQMKGTLPAKSEESNVIGYDTILSDITAYSKTLLSNRKNRVISEELATIEDIKNYKINKQLSLHQVKNPGITCMDLHKITSTLVTGGNDNHLIVFDYANYETVSTLKGHSKKVTTVLFGPQESIISGSVDKTVRVWSPDVNGYKANILASHNTSVLSVNLHPTNKYFTSQSEECWCFNDFETLTTIQKNSDNDMTSPFSISQFHPDGMLFSTGYQNGLINIWDMQTSAIVARLEGHTDKISSLSFSENGYYLASGSLDSTIRIWDLRKIKSIKSLSGESPVHSLTFDYSGTYLSFGGKDLRVYSVKTQEVLVTFSESTQEITGIKMSDHAKSIFSVSLDKYLRIYTN